MNVLKTAVLSAALFFGLAGTVLMAGCEADACLDLKCQNGGSCAENYCRCPSGFEGAECEFRTADRFLGTFVGMTTCDSSAKIQDTVTVFLVTSPSDVGIVRYADSILSNNTRDTLYGKVSGRRINIDDVVDGNRRRYSHAVITDKNFTFYEENVPNVNTPLAKTVCSFVGNKISTP
jgi:hypothetical protein